MYLCVEFLREAPNERTRSLHVLSPAQATATSKFPKAQHRLTLMTIAGAASGAAGVSHVGLANTIHQRQLQAHVLWLWSQVRGEGRFFPASERVCLVLSGL